jgi:hypothetical protein
MHACIQQLLQLHVAEAGTAAPCMQSAAFAVFYSHTSLREQLCFWGAGLLCMFSLLVCCILFYIRATLADVEHLPHAHVHNCRVLAPMHGACAQVFVALPALGHGVAVRAATRIVLSSCVCSCSTMLSPPHRPAVVGYAWYLCVAVCTIVPWSAAWL